MRTLIFGGGGQLASDLEICLKGSDPIPLTHADVDVCDHNHVRTVIQQHQPEVVINTAAFHHVDHCEEQWKMAYEVNGFACQNLAAVCREMNSILVYISTDYVFSGNKTQPYSEIDLPDPLSVYGSSKITGEFFVRTYCPEHIIVRSSGLYGYAGASGKGGNFVETIIRLANENKCLRVVEDQVLSPTYTRDLAQKIIEIIGIGGRGIFHVTNKGSCSWYEFAKKIFEVLQMDVDLSPTTTEEYGAIATRPAFSVLVNQRLDDLGIELLPDWQDALQQYLIEKGHL